MTGARTEDARKEIAVHVKGTEQLTRLGIGSLRRKEMWKANWCQERSNGMRLRKNTLCQRVRKLKAFRRTDYETTQVLRPASLPEQRESHVLSRGMTGKNKRMTSGAAKKKEKYILKAWWVEGTCGNCRKLPGGAHRALRLSRRTLETVTMTQDPALAKRTTTVSKYKTGRDRKAAFEAGEISDPAGTSCWSCDLPSALSGILLPNGSS